MSTTLRTFVIATIGATVLGAQRPTPDSSRAQRLPKVITTASRYAAPIDSLPRRVEVISRAELDATPSLDLVDVLKKRAGIDVVQYAGLLGGIGIRGFRPQVGSTQQRSMILLDGRPSGITNVAMLDLQDVERVEVLKGPASALYGSSAMGGVVNVVTRRRTGPRSGLFSAAGGSFGTSELRVQGGGHVAGSVDADISLRRYDQRDDYHVGAGRALRGVFGSDSAFKMYPASDKPNRYVSDTTGRGSRRDFTTFASTSGNVRVGGTIGQRLRVDVRGDLFDARDVATPGDVFSAGTAYPGSGRKDVRRGGGAVEFGGVASRHALLARVFTTDESSDNYDRPDSVRFVSYNATAVTTGVQLQDVVTAFGQQLVVGFDGTKQRATSRAFAAANSEIGTYSPNSDVSSVAAFGETRVTALGGRLVGTLGARVDRVTLSLLNTPLRTDVQAGDEAFTVFNPSAGALYGLGGGVRAHGSIGRAFLAPDAFGRAGLTKSVNAGVAAIAFGNPSLAPEHSVTTDIGLGISRLRGAFDLDVTYFNTDVTNRITQARASFAAGQRPTLADGTPVSRVQTSVNAGDAQIRGLEAAVRYDLGAALDRSWSLSAFASGTRIFSATETTPTVTVDAAQFNGVMNFSPSSIFRGVAIGAPNVERRIKNVASANWNLGLQFDDRRRFQAGLLGRYVGQRLDDDFSDFSDVSDIRYPAFAVLDLSGGVRLSRRVRADVQVSNVTDESYYEKRGYNLAGRAFTLRLSTAF